MNNELLYRIALSKVPNIGDVHAKILLQTFGNATEIFTASKKLLSKVDGIGTVRLQSLLAFNDFAACEKEVAFLKKFNITVLCLGDAAYPKRLHNCTDGPSLLYYKGVADLNTARIISIVGTRSSSDYGRQVCEKLIEDLQQENILIVSGLAFGIDTIAHKAALKNNLKTVGVLAHGLDRIYPAQNKSLAKNMCSEGGLLTEFSSNTTPDRENFPKRNRIVAGICDALVVIESGKKGGSLITAELANSYNKDVFAVPGRVNDVKSEGCNYLIKSNKASILTSAQDLLEMMNWQDTKKPSAKVQRELFVNLSQTEQLVANLLQLKSLSIDEINLQSNLSSSTVAAALLMLEMQGLVSSLPGKLYKLND